MWPIIQENNTKKIKSTVGIKVLANKEIKKKRFCWHSTYKQVKLKIWEI